MPVTIKNNEPTAATTKLNYAVFFQFHFFRF